MNLLTKYPLGSFASSWALERQGHNVFPVLPDAVGTTAEKTRRKTKRTIMGTFKKLFRTHATTKKMIHRLTADNPWATSPQCRQSQSPTPRKQLYFLKHECCYRRRVPYLTAMMVRSFVDLSLSSSTSRDSGIHDLNTISSRLPKLR